MRTDGDTWDIVSSVGRTALGVAAFRALESEGVDPLIHDEFARWFVEAAGEPHFISLLDDPSVLAGQDFLPRMMGPRTRFFDECFLDAAAQGVWQAVILAAGLDARAHRLDWPSGTTVYEIDRDSVLDFKDRVLTEHAARPKSDRRTVAVDLRDDWPASLIAAGFDAATPTAWSAEGLLPYLPGAAQDALFERINELSARGSRLASHNVPTGSGEQREKIRQFMESRGQRAMWGDNVPRDLWYDDDRNDPVQWLTEHGWTVHRFTFEELFSSYGRPLPELPDLPPEIAELRDSAAFWTAEKS